MHTRILLKLSGESMSGAGGYGIDSVAVASIAQRIADAVRTQKVQLAIVIGGGNIIRGARIVGPGLRRDTADHMGMLATVINALALGDALSAAGVTSHVMPVFPFPPTEMYSASRAREYLSHGDIVICPGGTGNPYITTDTTALIRALELDCTVVGKASTVDGVYSSDPKKDPAATRFETISAHQALRDNLQVLDGAALAIARENHIPIVVFDLFTDGTLERLVAGQPVGTTITP